MDSSSFQSSYTLNFLFDTQRRGCSSVEAEFRNISALNIIKYARGYATNWEHERLDIADFRFEPCTLALFKLVRH